MTVSAPTRRQFLVALGLAKENARGRFSAEGMAALAKAESEGVVFAEPFVIKSTKVPAKVSLVKRVAAAPVLTEAGRVREWARANDLPVGARGRMNPTLVAAFHANDVSLFKPVLAKVSIPKTVSLVKSTPTPARPDVDPKAARAWAISQGMQVGARGRLHVDVLNAFASSGVVSVPAVTKTTRFEQKHNGEQAVSHLVTEARAKVAASSVRVRPETTGFVYAPRPEGAPEHVSEPLVRVSTCGGCSKGISFCACKSGPRAPGFLGGGLLSLDKPAALG